MVSLIKEKNKEGHTHSPATNFLRPMDVRWPELHRVDTVAIVGPSFSREVPLVQ
jgi:hypothetical protein